MLKRLELVGFKSFADRTIFDFHPGITGIVGPNGSGKSNIVDAVRWIMGEQSAKSLRGGEMADVIFNGSTSRKGYGLAEVTMTFDNAKRQLTLDADEIQITRRVHRTGEGEYLINNQVCRLKDIKELFLGSGAGNDAYCIIEQGKVDILLQASTKDRRLIFEEAAGISRFKAKKIETLRKLERVDQNLSRVKDIIDEVDKQLRSVKLQASKAERYHEYSTRLKKLRIGLGLLEYGKINERLEVEEKLLQGLRGELDQRAARAGACEAEAERLEMHLADLEDELRERESGLAQIVQQIKTEQTTRAHEDALTVDLETELSTTRKRCAALTGRVRLLARAAVECVAELTGIEGEANAKQQEVALLDHDLRETLKQLQAVQERAAREKAEHLELMRRAAHLQNDAVATRAHVDNLKRERQRLQHRSDQVAESLASVDLELQELESADEALHHRLAQARQSLADSRGYRERLRHECDASGAAVARLREQRSGLASRVEVLETLIRTHEGLGAGPREVFSLLEAHESAAWGAVLGMLADFLTVKREHAHLIDLALGEQAQSFLVRDLNHLLTALKERVEPLPGRASFLPCVAPASESQSPPYAILKDHPAIEFTVLSRLKNADLRSQQPEFGSPPTSDGENPARGLVAPADQLVSCDQAELADLPARILGRTLIVRDLPTARRLLMHAPGFRFVTLEGELLEADGALTVGTQKAESGLLTRKSELLDLKDQIAALDCEIAEAEQRLALARQTIEDDGQSIQTQQEEIDVLAEQAADFRARVQQHRDRRLGLHQEVALQQDELLRLEEDMEVHQSAWQTAQDEAAAAEAKVLELQESIRRADLDAHQFDQERQKKAQAFTAGQIGLAKIEERLAGVRARHDQQTNDLAQRRLELDAGRAALASCRDRLQQSQENMLRASASVARLYLDKEASQAQVAQLVHQRDTRRLDRGRLAQQAQAVRTEWRGQQENFHKRELAATELRHQRQTLVDRLREDYQIELAELAVEGKKSEDRSQESEVRSEGEDVGTEELVAGENDVEAVGDGGAVVGANDNDDVISDPEAAQREIEELRRKLSRLGSVNMEALAELTDLEGRTTTLQVQYDDLVSAKKSLEEIIAKINEDSRTLFTDILTVIRGHFQELFRKLFGGGMADIILEDEADVLESGIEINARPPGKELRSISLMSGGEKTLTAVALLLAIFRSKPSPFCLLDEVDAALDEANIGRFTNVLRDFLDLSQFIIVTHSKRTMGIADVLYGITMQESGISKQVAIRFEDWIDPEESARAIKQSEVA